MSDKSISHIVKEAILNSRIRDNLITDDETLVLSAKQGLILKGILDTLVSNAIMADGSRDMDSGYSPLNPLSVINKEYFELNQNLNMHTSVGTLLMPLSLSGAIATFPTYIGAWFHSSDCHPSLPYIYFASPDTGLTTAQWSKVHTINRDTGALDEIATLPDIPTVGSNTDLNENKIFQTNDGSIYAMSARLVSGVTARSIVFYKYNTGTGVWDLHWVTDEGWDATYALFDGGSYDWKYEETSGNKYFVGTGIFSGGSGNYRVFDIENKVVVPYIGTHTWNISGMLAYDGKMYATGSNTGLISGYNYINGTTLFTDSPVKVGNPARSSMVAKDGVLYVGFTDNATDKIYKVTAINMLTGDILLDGVISTTETSPLYDMYLDSTGAIQMVYSSGTPFIKESVGESLIHPVRYELINRINGSDIEGDKSVNLCYDSDNEVSGAIGENSFVAGVGALTPNMRGAIALGRFNIDTDSIFIVGVGTDNLNRANVFEITEEGRIVAPLITDAIIDDDSGGLSGKTLITKEYLVSSVVDNLTTQDATKSLSAKQGFVLKGFIDAINTLLTSNDVSLDELQELVDFIKANRDTLNSLGIANIAGLQTALDSKADKNSSIVLHSDALRLSGSNISLHKADDSSETIDIADATRVVKHISAGTVPVPIANELTHKSLGLVYWWSSTGDSHPNNTQHWILQGGGSTTASYLTPRSINKVTGVMDEVTIANIPSTGLSTNAYKGYIFQTMDGSLYNVALRAMGNAILYELVFYKYNTVTLVWDLYWETGIGQTSNAVLGEGAFDWKYEETNGSIMWVQYGAYSGIAKYFHVLDVGNKAIIPYFGSDYNYTPKPKILLYNGVLYYRHNLTYDPIDLYAVDYINSLNLYGAVQISPLTYIDYSDLVMNNGTLYHVHSLGNPHHVFEVDAINPATGAVTGQAVSIGSYDATGYSEGMLVDPNGNIKMLIKGDDNYIYTRGFVGSGSVNPVRLEIAERVFSSDVEGHKSVNLCYDLDNEVSGAMAENSFVAGAGALTNNSIRGAIALGRFNVDTNSIFVVGAGADHLNRANVFEITEDGRIVAPLVTNQIIDDDTDGLSNKTLVTKEYIKASPQSLHATDALSLVANILYLNKADGTNEQIDLSLYLDDTNLAQIISGTYVVDEPLAGDKSLKFTRDDASVFYIDASMFFDDTNLVLSVDGQSGAVDLSGTYEAIDINIVRKNIATTFTAPIRTAYGTEDNLIDFTTNNDFKITLGASLTVTASVVTGCDGQGGKIIIADVQNIAGWSGFTWVGTTPTFTTGLGMFEYKIDGATVYVWMVGN